MSSLTSWDLKHTELAFKSSEFLFNLSTQVRDILIDYLKVLFKETDLGKRFNYQEDEKLTKLFIGSTFPMEERYFPRVLVDVNVSDSEIISFGDVGYDDKNNIVLTGRFNYNAVLTISALELEEIKNLADVCLLFIVNRYYRSQLQKYGIGVVDARGFRVSAIRRERLVPTIPFWLTEVSFVVYSEWQQLIEKKGVVISGEIVEIEI
jgi:hypothetical protein